MSKHKNTLSQVVDYMKRDGSIWNIRPFLGLILCSLADEEKQSNKEVDDMPLKTKFYKVVFPEPYLNPVRLISCSMRGPEKKVYMEKGKSLKVNEGLVFRSLRSAIKYIPGDGTIPHVAMVWECEVDRVERVEYLNVVEVDGCIYGTDSKIDIPPGTSKAYGIKLTKRVWHEAPEEYQISSPIPSPEETISLLTHKVSRDLYELKRRYVDYYVQLKHDYPEVTKGPIGRISRAIMEVEACEEEFMKEDK